MELCGGSSCAADKVSDEEVSMRNQVFVIVFVVMLVVPQSVFGQTTGAAGLQRTPDGRPDLQGAWSFATITPLERPSEYSGREFLTDEEVASLNEDAATRASSGRREELSAQRDVDLAYDQFWWDRGTSDGRTSLIVDPADGRIPFTVEGRDRIDLRRSLRDRPARGPEDRSPGERCVHHTKAGPPMSSGGYNNHLRLLQTSNYVVIYTEQIHDARIIPMDGRAKLTVKIEQWMGSSRGHWNGDTLVVETRNFNGKASFQGSSTGLILIERFTRRDADTLTYEYTLKDPEIYERAWTAALDLKPLDGDMYEFACHEGNYGMTNLLAGARVEERAGR